VKPSDIQDQFKDLGIAVWGVTNEDPGTILEFHQVWELNFPLLRDVDGQHVDAWGIRNTECEAGSVAFGTPHHRREPGRGHPDRPDLDHLLVRPDRAVHANRAVTVATHGAKGAIDPVTLEERLSC
jgi:hypothetical protein